MSGSGVGANNDRSTSNGSSKESNSNNRSGVEGKQSFDRAMDNADRPDRKQASSVVSNNADTKDKAETRTTNKRADKPDPIAGSPGISASPKSARDAAIEMANAELGVDMQSMRQGFDQKIDKSVAVYDQKIADVDQRLAEINDKLSSKSRDGVLGLGMIGHASTGEARTLMAEGRALTDEKRGLEASRARLESARELPDALDMGHIAKDVYAVDTQLTNSHISRVSDQELKDLGFDTTLLDNEKSGFRAEVYRNSNTGETVLAFKGTDFDSREDWGNNALQGLGRRSPQYEQAARVAREFDGAFAGEKRALTGHSLGGGLAAYASLTTGIEATTFNAAGLNAKTLDRIGATREEALDLVTAHHVDGEVLNWAQDSNAADLAAAGILGTRHTIRSDFDPVPEAVGTRFDYPALGPDGQPPNYRGGPRSDIAEKVELHFMDSMLNTLRQENQWVTMEALPQ